MITLDGAIRAGTGSAEFLRILTGGKGQPIPQGIPGLYAAITGNALAGKVLEPAMTIDSDPKAIA